MTTNPVFAQTRRQLAEKVNRSPENASLIAKLGLVDALLDNKKEAISEAKHATEMLPISRDALDGPGVAINLAVVSGASLLRDGPHFHPLGFVDRGGCR